MAGPVTLVYDATRRQAFNVATISTVSSASVQSPANAAYTQADQTALATCVKNLVVAVNAIIGALNAANITDN